MWMVVASCFYTTLQPACSITALIFCNSHGMGTGSTRERGGGGFTGELQGRRENASDQP